MALSSEFLVSIADPISPTIHCDIESLFATTETRSSCDLKLTSEKKKHRGVRVMERQLVTCTINGG
ncbi:hypothetical protein J6590_092030 [Homalodisca vitripennis]|nr:hypothetical protein J6590_092030 [Homalodisca vitripennis]